MLLLFGICALYIVFVCVLFSGTAIVHFRWQKSDGFIFFGAGLFAMVVGGATYALVFELIKQGILKQ